MTNHEALSEGDLWARADGDYGPEGDDWKGWDGRDEWDEWDEWGQYPLSAAHPGPDPNARQRHTSRLLLVLIGLAAATFVVATALLVTGRYSGQMPASPRLESRTSTPAPASATPGRAGIASSTPISPRTSSVVAPSPPVDDAGSEPVESVPAGGTAPPVFEPSEPPIESPIDRGDSGGPRTNVTRPPMSFTPGDRGN